MVYLIKLNYHIMFITKYIIKKTYKIIDYIADFIFAIALISYIIYLF